MTAASRVPAVDRERVLAHRAARQGLHRTTRTASELAVLDIGVQDSMVNSGVLALSARLPQPVTGVPDGITVLWSVRGSPHLHRDAEVVGLAASLYPDDEADAAGRFGAMPLRSFRQAGISALDGLDRATRVLAELLAAAPGPTGKGDLSAAMTKALPAGFSYECRGCRSFHVYDTTMRIAGPGAGAVIGVARPLALTRGFTPGPTPDPATARAARAGLVRAYLRLLGPATPTEVAGYLGARTDAVKAVWPDDTVDVRSGRRRSSILEADLPDLLSPPEPPVARLLPPSDPFLQARDRETLVPDEGLRGRLWKILGNPGALLLDGEPAGTWRATGTGTLTIAVDAWRPLSAAQRREIAAEADRVAAVRGATRLTLSLGPAGP